MLRGGASLALTLLTEESRSSPLRGSAKDIMKAAQELGRMTRAASRSLASKTKSPGADAAARAADAIAADLKAERPRKG